jgi:hypothetical protein
VIVEAGAVGGTLGADRSIPPRVLAVGTPPG